MESKIGQGTAFSFVLPCNCSVFELKDFAASNPVQNEGHPHVIENQFQERVFCNETDKSESESTVMVVEDDPQLNNFLVSVLKDSYRIISAHDGEKGLKMIRQAHPDLVISDIMMPKMDGYELTKAIKENKELCHIPVILLTAKTEVSSQIEGMQSGADQYISKPFHVDYLLSAIDSQLKNRKRIQDIFLHGRMPGLEKSDMHQLDIIFLSKLNALLEKELANADLDIQFLARNLNMSRSVFYRKFMSLTNVSPISYIRKYRINKSVELMQTGRYSLAEIGEMTGFGSPSYFSTAFKQEKGTGPREYINQLRDQVTSES
jgi:DNA-binding response OmpR family regulator